ncbi:MAG TPA: tetratricopeptide repeat protein, partial [Fimbriimonas sp.]
QGIGSVSDIQCLTDRIGRQGYLILLDNCEHLVQHVALLAESLLSRCPNIRVLATSRTALDVLGEQCVLVRGLEMPDETTNEDSELISTESIRLFLDRAKAVEPRFRITPENLCAVRNLVRGVDGLPLAIQLAAAKVRVLSAEEILEERRHGLGILRGSRSSLSYRHASMDEAIAASYEPLEHKERMLLGRLAVFRGGWTLRAARDVVCDDCITTSELPDYLEKLVLKSLVDVGYEQDAASRYRLLEPIREFVLEHDPVSSAEVAEKHFEWVRRLAAKVESELKQSLNPELMNILDAEQRNIERALEWSRVAGNNLAALEVVTALYRYWVVRGHSLEGLQWTRSVLDASREADPVLQARALNAIGVYTEMQGFYEESRQAHEEALRIRRQLQDDEGVASSLSNIGLLARASGDFATAHECFEEALALSEKSSASPMLPYALVNLGCTFVDSGEAEIAIPYLERCIAESRARNDAHNLCSAALSLADSYIRLGNETAASEWLQVCLDSALSIRAGLSVSRFLFIYAKLASKRGDYDIACRSLGCSRMVYRQCKAVASPTQETEWRNLEEEIHSAIGEPACARLTLQGSHRKLESVLEEVEASIVA